MNFSYCKKEKTEALGKNGVQNKIVLYPNSCYIDTCYNEVDCINNNNFSQYLG